MVLESKAESAMNPPLANDGPRAVVHERDEAVDMDPAHRSRL